MKHFSHFFSHLFFSHQEKQTDNQITVPVTLTAEDVLLLLKCKSQLPDLILHIERELRS